MKVAVLILLYFFNFYLIPLEGLIEIKNIECNTLDKSFSHFEYCYIRSKNRTYKYISLKAQMFKRPINNVTVAVDVRKKANGYKPFLFNLTFDACKFMRTKSNPIVRYFYSYIKSHSNMNHTCPYDHDIILDKLDIGFINNLATTVLPIPEGEYGIYTTWSVFNIPRNCVNVFAVLS